MFQGKGFCRIDLARAMARAAVCALVLGLFVGGLFVGGLSAGGFTAGPAAAGDAEAATDAGATAVETLTDDELLTCEAQPYQVKVTVEDMRNLDGLLTVELYNDNPEGFIKKAGRLERYRVDATRSQSEICIVAPGPGTYAVVLYHDENGNRKFDKNFLGIPKEGFGVSNNPGFSLGPPAYEDSSFNLGDEPVVLTISMTYL